MNIGEAAKASGMTAKMIRYYERIGLIKKAVRSYSGYRHYDATDLDTLRFIARARRMGFSLEKIAELLKLWRNTQRPSAKVKAIAEAHIIELDSQIKELMAMREILKNISDRCPGSDNPHCPILTELADHAVKR